MAPKREGLRPLKPKPDRPPPKSNAQKCREYKERIKQDPAALELWKMKKKVQRLHLKETMTPEQKQLERDKARIRQQKRRAKLKTKNSPIKSTKSAPLQRLERQYKTRDRCQKEADVREKNRLRQQKRRAGLTPQKSRRINEKRRERYHEQRKSASAIASSDKTISTSKRKVKLTSLLRGIHKTLKDSRTKLSLFKLDFVKKLLKRQHSHKSSLSYYKFRTKNNSFGIEAFLAKAAIDFPGQRGSSRPKKVLTKPMSELYKEYKVAHPSVKTSLTTFKRRRPKDILLSSSNKFNQCLCETCVNSMLLVECLNPLLDKAIEKRPSRGCVKIKSVDDLVSRTLCDSDRRECWERACKNCGTGPFMGKIRKALCNNLHDMRKWGRWERTERSPKDLVYKENTLVEILDMLQQDLEGLAMHLKTASWQRKQYQYLKENLPRQHVMCTVDFAENYLCKFQNEVQSAHWSYRQITIHPCVYFYRCSKPECFKTLTKYVIYISDDMKHDNFFTRHVIDQCLSENVKNEMVAFHLFSDGCSAQYKSRFTFKDLADLQEKHKTIQINRHYFGASHGKSLCDSCGGTIKNAAARAVVSGSHIIQSAEDMFNFCSQKLTVCDPSSQNECIHPDFTRSFCLIRKDDILRGTRSNSNLVRGIRNIHFLSPVEKNKVLVKNLSCFCERCLLGGQDRCENEKFTLDWKMIELSKSCRRTCSQKSQTQFPSASPCPALAEVFASTSRESDVDAMDIHSLSVSTNRRDFFQNLQQGFSFCTCFDELYHLVKSVLPFFQNYPLPELINRTAVEVGCVDAIAMQFVPPALKNKLFPVVTTADGNCVPRALSILCFGNQEHHIEIRCRLVAELVSNSLDYLCLDRDELNFVCEQSQSCSSSVKETFHLEVLDICKTSTTMGLWQLMAAANVFNVTILSVYPELGPVSVQHALNCSLSPRMTIEETSLKFSLLWSATEEHSDRMPKHYWTANHVVPLLQLFHETSTVSIEKN